MLCSCPKARSTFWSDADAIVCPIFIPGWVCAVQRQLSDYSYCKYSVSICPQINNLDIDTKLLLFAGLAYEGNFLNLLALGSLQSF
jgi:hypothetical protein